jgi:uncharacterized protein
MRALLAGGIWMIAIDLLLMLGLGFFGSFGHCVGMCGPLTVALALSHQPSSPTWLAAFRFHSLLNMGRLLSYLLVGGLLGSASAMVVASGQLVGMGSDLRATVVTMSGCLLIWWGGIQIKPQLLPPAPQFLQVQLRQWINSAMAGQQSPAFLGLCWGMMPCGFLYAAQLKAIETGDLRSGAATMLAFGLGTMPMMLGVGVASSRWSSTQHSQLRRAGGWITVIVGIMTLARTGEAMVDRTGYGALICLATALLARPLSRSWPTLLSYRRLLGVGALLLSIAHVLHMAEHTWSWNLEALFFMLPRQQAGIWSGVAALLCLVLPAATSFDRAQQHLGQAWRQLHLLAVPALLLGAVHCLLIGASYFGTVQSTDGQQWRSIGLMLAVVLILLLRCRWFWSLLSIEKLYAPPK